jgi:hypothetical protein
MSLSEDRVFQNPGGLKQSFGKIPHSQTQPIYPIVTALGPAGKQMASPMSLRPVTSSFLKTGMEPQSWINLSVHIYIYIDIYQFWWAG